MDIHSRVRASPSPLWHSCLAWFAFALGLAGCGGGGSTDSGPRLERLTEAPTSAGAATTLAGPATTAGQRKFALASQSTFITNPAVASGAFHTLALKNDGTVWAWGFSTDGQLGTNTPSSEVPAQVLGLGGSGVSTDVRAIAAGGFHSLALKRDGTVWAWGFGGEGQLGNNSLLSTATPMQVLDVNGVDKLEGIAAIAAGGFFSLAFKRDGSLLAWGQGFAGQLGNNATARSAIPVQVLVSGGDGVFSNVRAIACGLWFALALAGDGSLWSWGCGGQGQLGSNDNVNRSAPQPVLDATGVVSFVDVTAIAARNFHSLAVKSDGTVWAWGLGFNGQLGSNSTASHSLPVQALDVSGANALGDARSVWAGSFHSLARTVDGTARSWGFGASGQLGNNQSRDSALPVRVTDATSIGALDRVFALAGSSNFTVALRGDGSVWAWGSGRLGNGSIGVSLAPTQVVGPSGLGFLNLGLPDEISPVIVYSGNLGTYTVEQNVSISCMATDEGSGVASTDCVNIEGPAYAFSVGKNDFSASATDAVGNTGGASTRFRVEVTPTSLITLTTRFVNGQGAKRSLTNLLQLAAAAGSRGNMKAKAALRAAYVAELSRLPLRVVSAEDSATLIRLLAYL